MADNSNQSFPSDNLVRAIHPGFEIRANENGMPTLESRFIQYDTFTEIDSAYEGHFMERIAPGALRKTLAENRDSIKVLLEHGKDPTVGNKPLGAISEIRDDNGHAVGVVPLLDTSYVRDLVPALQAGLYGSSFRFKVIKEDVVRTPARSDSNPQGLPERTITELRLYEFGPVLFPAYEGATAAVRSMTDRFIDRALTSGDVPANLKPEPVDATPEPVKEKEPEHSESSRSTPKPDKPQTKSEATEETKMSDHQFRSVEEIDARLDEIRAKHAEMAAEAGVRAFDTDTKSQWDELKLERDALEVDKAEYLERKAYLDQTATTKRDSLERGAGHNAVKANRNAAPDNPFDLGGYHERATSHEHLGRLYSEGGKAALETFYYPHERADNGRVSGHLEKLLRADGQEKEIAQRFIIMGSPVYRSAFWKSLMRQPLTGEEQQSMVAASMLEARSISTTQTGGVTVPIQIDPTLIPTSNGVLNPFRAISRNVTTTSYIWQGVTQAGITFNYRAEGATMTDNTPTLVARPIQPERADAFIPFTWEAGQDWGALESELAVAIQDGKDAAEATKFAVGAGHGSNEPQGVLAGAGTVVGTSANTVLAVGDVYALENALPPRYQQNATWLMTNAVGQKVRQFVAAAGPAQWGDSLAQGQPERLIGHPIYKASTVGTAGSSLVSTARWGVIGDFSRYVIVDRVGLQVRAIDNLFSGNTAGGLAYPVGMSGVVAYYRNSAGVVDSNAFRVGTIT